MAGNDDHLLRISQVYPDDRINHRHQGPESFQPPVAIAVTPGHATTVERPPAAWDTLAAWRAVWGAPRQPGLRRPVRSPDRPRAQQPHRHPGPGRDRGGDLRQLHAVITTAERWDSHRHPRRQTLQRGAHRRLTPGGPSSRVGASPTRHGGTSVTSTLIMGSPARRLLNPITRCRDQPHYGYAGTGDRRGTDPTALKQAALR
jgi:hypothetical protein